MFLLQLKIIKNLVFLVIIELCYREKFILLDELPQIFTEKIFV